MSKKLIMGGLIFLMICFFLLSGICFLTAKNHQGSMIYSGLGNCETSSQS